MPNEGTCEKTCVATATHEHPQSSQLAGAMAGAEKTSNLTDADMQETIRRLKCDQKEDFDEGLKQGKQYGVAWAKDEATLGQLRLVSEANEDLGPDDLQQILGDHWDAEALNEMIQDHDADSFLAGYARGFCDAVKSVWLKIRKHF
jgi:hypothetical protein